MKTRNKQFPLGVCPDQHDIRRPWTWDLDCTASRGMPFSNQEAYSRMGCQEGDGHYLSRHKTSLQARAHPKGTVNRKPEDFPYYAAGMSGQQYKYLPSRCERRNVLGFLCEGFHGIQNEELHNNNQATVKIICPAGIPLGSSEVADGHQRTLASATATTRTSDKKYMAAEGSKKDATLCNFLHHSGGLCLKQRPGSVVRISMRCANLKLELQDPPLLIAAGTSS